MADVTIPSFGESITEVYVATWLVEVGQRVEVDQPLVSLETDKAAQDLPSPIAGVLTEQLFAPDDAAAIGDVIARIDTSATASAPAPAAVPDNGGLRPRSSSPPSASAQGAPASPPALAGREEPLVMPAAARVLAEAGVDAANVQGTGPGGRVLKQDAVKAAGAGWNASTSPAKPAATEWSAKTTPATPPATAAPAPAPAPEPEPAPAPKAAPAPAPEPAPAPTAVKVRGERTKQRIKMTRLRRRIAERLVSAQNDAAILTTFNEADMSAVMRLRAAHKQAFIDKYGIKLGFMSFFVKACVDALKQLPAINAQVDGDHVIYHDYFDIGVAVGGGRGLVVPIIRNAERLSFAEIEQTIADFGKRAQAGTLLPDEMIGGTFSISNGGVYGSMMSTPILNPPQSGILGMHNIIKRPIAVGPKGDERMELRPMMYLALSYDHRIVDGREAVTFLRRVKACIEAPERMLLEV